MKKKIIEMFLKENIGKEEEKCWKSFIQKMLHINIFSRGTHIIIYEEGLQRLDILHINIYKK